MYFFSFDFYEAVLIQIHIEFFYNYFKLLYYIFKCFFFIYEIKLKIIQKFY